MKEKKKQKNEAKSQEKNVCCVIFEGILSLILIRTDSKKAYRNANFYSFQEEHWKKKTTV